MNASELMIPPQSRILSVAWNSAGVDDSERALEGANSVVYLSHLDPHCHKRKPS
ncbi:hypothetical protein [Nostoc sp. TCL26-01]|uniref:hypothetical protein n=1 Tax=Nostoc sp. TCL26-01 TaxID=2576904 RepID=UPI0015BFE9DD|nr:hypothetical protein [Nostoc sp. TCL26-01]